ncbi:Ketosteroid isomerase-related protein [Mycolicibacterium rutilum]|uniref:Ketosteroid isomerase-related protein n=1 Tax=Mycolicibacterium rutilum TaxID=370526 RepID=A0A1H6M261_MYCRU|nr:nuclear transport factor 2 family protein [Mycolicibacterium rutilum]SEH92046.1 Ketosteroid isomerase-related protein [Mycolicibacterium rutilum]
MTTATDVAQRLYAALAAADGEALVGLLTDDFVGTVSAGMPHQVGGVHRGALDMIGTVWGRIAELYEMHVDPTEYLAVDADRVVVLGRYRGPARDGATTVDADFAHVITTRGERIAALRQITDTANWRIPRR